MASDPTAEAVAVIKLCDRLTDRLRFGGSSGALSAVEQLRKAFPALVKALRAARKLEMEIAVAAAVGAALTHMWKVRKEGIDCARCGLGTVDSVLQLGALPECDPESGCCSFSRRHLIVMDGDVPGSRRCTYCQTVYLATAPVGVSS